MSVLDDAMSWMRQHPNRARLLNNPELCLWYYAIRHPKKHINSDFEFKNPQVHVGSQIFDSNYVEHFFTFSLEKGLGTYAGDKLGWKGEYVGLNEEGLILCITSGYDLKVIDSEHMYFFPNSLLKLVLANKWYFPKSGYKPKLYALPVCDVEKTLSMKNIKTLADFVN